MSTFCATISNNNIGVILLIVALFTLNFLLFIEEPGVSGIILVHSRGLELAHRLHHLLECSQVSPQIHRVIAHIGLLRLSIIL